MEKLSFDSDFNSEERATFYWRNANSRFPENHPLCVEVLGGGHRIGYYLNFSEAEQLLNYLAEGFKELNKPRKENATMAKTKKKTAKKKSKK